MLVLSRKLNEQIRIGENITVTVLRVKGNAVRIGIEAPRNVRVVRSELPPKTNLPVDGDSAAGTTVEGGGRRGEDLVEESSDIGRSARGPLYAKLLQLSAHAV